MSHQQEEEPSTRDLGELSPSEAKQLMKAAYKEAAAEWLDEQFKRFGKWSLAGLASAGLVALVYFILSINGWHK